LILNPFPLRTLCTDDSTYDAVFQTVSGDTLILRVHFPLNSHPSAPVKAPAMTLAGVKARHDWLDQRMRVTGHPPVLSDAAFRDAKITLGAAVHEVIKHFQLEPPQVLEVTDAGLRAIQKPGSVANRQKPSNGSRANQQFPSHPPQVNSASQHSSGATDAPPDYETLLQVPEIDMPPIPKYFEELDQLSREELDRLLENEIEFLAFCNKLPVMQTIQTISMATVKENVEQAETNLKSEEELNQLYKEVSGLEKELAEKVTAFQKLEKEQDGICAPPDKKKIMRDLTKAKKQAYDESEQIAEDWLDDGDGSAVSQFIKEFLDKRKVHHVRAAKLELLQHDSGNNNSRTL